MPLRSLTTLVVVACAAAGTALAAPHSDRAAGVTPLAAVPAPPSMPGLAAALPATAAPAAAAGTVQLAHHRKYRRHRHGRRHYHRGRRHARRYHHRRYYRHRPYRKFRPHVRYGYFGPRVRVIERPCTTRIVRQTRYGRVVRVIDRCRYY